MEKETELKAKQITIQSLVDFMGNEIVKRQLTDTAVKAIGEVEINKCMYQIQLILESDKDKWIEGIGVKGIFKAKNKLSCLKKKIISLFTSTTDAEPQK